MTISWNITPEESWGDLALRQQIAIEADILRFVASLTDQVAAWMQAEARWEDRTGEARAGLYADVEHVVRESVDLVMSHGPAIEYAVFLEYGFAGRLSVLPDALDNWFPVLYRGVVEIVRRHSS